MPDRAGDLPIEATELSRLRWRCRRGLLENDLFLERFLRQHGASLTGKRARSLNQLLELSDNDLLDLLLGKRTLAQVDSKLDQDDVSEILGMLKENR
ncbi:MAG: succinate dehydrogenase assembly factor 2 [Burkholderiaceae bacterium]